MASVMIGIQARSTSKRLPGKSLEIIDDKFMISHVLDACQQSAKYLSNTYRTDVALLVPYDDPIKQAFDGALVIEGPEDDVLERYNLAVKKMQPDYIVRVTGDCPLMVPTIISKHVLAAIGHRRDYVSNSFDELRTYLDGYDCEIISKELFRWTVSNAKSSYDKEHVTTLIKRQPPFWAKFGAVISFIDLSDLKYSVDTIDELERVRKNKESIKHKLQLAKDKGYQVYRI